MRFGFSAAFKILGFGLGVLMLGTSLQAADAAANFKEKCVMCHGSDGKGLAALKTPDFTDAKWQASQKDKDLTDAIKNGKKGTMMQPFAGKLQDDEIQALVHYIRAFDSSKKK